MDSKDNEMNTAGQIQECKELLDLSTPQLYRRNLFRVLGLSVGATTVDARRQLKRLEMQRKLGVAQNDGSGGPLALKPPATEDEIRHAMDRLNDPHARLLDELFWFWPTDGESASDPALKALEDGQAKQAHELWIRLAGRKDHGQIAEHNLAILGHLAAIDHEARLAGQKAQEQTPRLAKVWTVAFSHWRAVLDGEEFWSRVRDRIRQLNDGGLTTGMVHRIRRSLPKTLLMINAQMALEAAERDDAETATRHVAVIQDARLGEGLAEEVLRESLAPLRGRIKVLCEAAELKAGKDPKHANVETRNLVKEAMPLLSIVDVILQDSDPIRQGLHDYVASTALSCQINYGNTTEDWDDSLALLELVLPIAAGNAIADRIRDNMTTVKSNISLSRCWFCEKNKADEKSRVEVKMFGDVATTRLWNTIRTTWRHTTLYVPRCPSCAAVHGREALWTIILGVVGVLLGIGGCAISRNEDMSGAVFFILTAAGIISGAVTDYRKRPAGVKRKSTMRQFPAVKDLLAQKWQFGEKPNTQG